MSELPEPSHWPDVLLFPIWKYPLHMAFSDSAIAAEPFEVLRMHRGWWWDFNGKKHRTYRCDRCKTTFFGSKFEDFGHGCNETKLGEAWEIARW